MDEIREELWKKEMRIQHVLDNIYAIPIEYRENVIRQVFYAFQMIELYRRQNNLN